jgi:hypothetical protein
MRIDALAFLTAATLLGCTTEDPAPFAPEVDGAAARRDGGPIRVRVMDAGARLDADIIDGSDSMRTDTGVMLPRIDGIIDAREWAGALEFTTSTDPTPRFPNDRLHRLLAIRTDSMLFLAIAGELDAESTMMLLLDTAFGSDEGAVLSGAVFLDFDGALDSAISETIWLTDAPDFRPEYAWGTTFMPFSSTAADADSGWRAIASPSGMFEWLSRGVISRCSETQCETTIALDTPGFTSTGTIAVAVRIGNVLGELSNQTLPLDDPNSPETLTEFLLIPPL